MLTIDLHIHILHQCLAIAIILTVYLICIIIGLC